MYPKLQLTLMTMLIFMIISSMPMYNKTNAYIAQPLNLEFMDDYGYPTRIGLIVHSIVAGLLMNLYLMTFKF